MEISKENTQLDKLIKQAAILAATYYQRENNESLEELHAVIELIARYGYHINLEPHGSKAHPQVRIALWRLGVPAHLFQNWREAVNEDINGQKTQTLQETLRKMNFSIIITNREKKIETASYTIYAAWAQLIYSPHDERYEEHAIFIKKLHSPSEEKAEVSNLAEVLDPSDMQFLGF